jgi:hypothetical protein
MISKDPLVRLQPKVISLLCYEFRNVQKKHAIVRFDCLMFRVCSTSTQC